MIALLQSFDREYFDLALAGEGGHFVEIGRSLPPKTLHVELPRFMGRAEAEGLNLLIRPLRSSPDAPTFLRLDDCSEIDLERWAPHACLTLRTRTDRYQCWLAFNANDARSTAQLPEHSPKPVEMTEAAGFVPLAGARFIPSDDHAPRHFPVRIIQGIAGRLTLAHQLESAAPFPNTCMLQ